MDLSPWTDDVLLLDNYDIFPSTLYMFNLETHEMKFIGKFHRGLGFFLQCDILKQANPIFPAE